MSDTITPTAWYYLSPDVKEMIKGVDKGICKCTTTTIENITEAFNSVTKNRNPSNLRSKGFKLSGWDNCPQQL